MTTFWGVYRQIIQSTNLNELESVTIQYWQMIVVDKGLLDVLEHQSLILQQS